MLEKVFLQTVCKAVRPSKTLLPTITLRQKTPVEVLKPLTLFLNISPQGLIVFIWSIFDK